MTGYAGEIVTLRVDLNRLRGNRIATRRDFVVGGGDALPKLAAGDVVRVVEEEGDTYLAAVERVQDKLVYLWVDLDSWAPAIENAHDYSLHASEFRPGLGEPETTPVMELA